MKVIDKILTRLFQVLMVGILIGFVFIAYKFNNIEPSRDLDDYKEYLDRFEPNDVPQFPKSLNSFKSCKVFFRPVFLQGGTELHLACLFNNIEEAQNTFQQIPDSTLAFEDQFQYITMENELDNTSRYFGYDIHLGEANEQTKLVLADCYDHQSWNHGIISKAVYVPNTRFIIYSVDAW